jgi:hypothetical protein
MKRNERRANSRLADALRHADPVITDSAMTEGERRRIRARLMDVRPGTSPGFAYRWFRPALAVAAALLLVAVGSSWLTRERRSTTPVPNAAGVEDVAVRSTTEGRAAQQVRFVTSGGTQIIWLLGRDLDR